MPAVMDPSDGEVIDIRLDDGRVRFGEWGEDEAFIDVDDAAVTESWRWE